MQQDGKVTCGQEHSWREWEGCSKTGGWTNAGLGRGKCSGQRASDRQALRPSASYAWQALIGLPVTLAADGSSDGSTS